MFLLANYSLNFFIYCTVCKKYRVQLNSFYDSVRKGVKKQLSSTDVTDKRSGSLSSGNGHGRGDRLTSVTSVSSDRSAGKRSSIPVTTIVKKSPTRQTTLKLI